MKKYIYIMPSIVLLLANSFIVKGNTLKSSLSRKDKIKPLEKKNQRAIYEDYYQEAGIPINYDLDYYPFRSYLNDDNKDEPFIYKESPHNIVKKHKNKFRSGYNKEKNLNSRTNNLNSPKIKIKSQKRSKTNFKTKSRRNIQLADNTHFVKNDNNVQEFTNEKGNLDENLNIQQSYFPQDVNDVQSKNSLVDENMADENVYNDKYTIENRDLTQPEIIENYNFDAYKTSNKKSPYDYLHIYNRSHNVFNDKVGLKYEFPPDEFNYKSLRRVLGEPMEVKALQLPQCPAYKQPDNLMESARNNLQTGRVEQLNRNTREKFNTGVFRKRKRLERSHEENGSKSVNLRKRRAHKTNFFTLTFPAIEAENLASYISLRDWPTEITQNARCTRCTTTPTTCSTTPQCTFLTVSEEATTCSSESTTLCTTTEECTTTEACTTTEICTTESKCTTCARSFKELNEGSRIYMDLSNFVSNMYHPLPVYNATVNDNQKIKRQKFMVPYVLPSPNIQTVNSALLNARNDDIKIIKLEPRSLIQRSNNGTQHEMKDNIYIVKLLKDLSSVGKLKEIPLQSQKSFYSVPYAPRVRRQLIRG